MSRPAPTARTATPAATLPGFSLAYDVALSLPPLRKSRAVLRYSSTSTFCIEVFRLFTMSSLMPSLPRNCSSPLFVDALRDCPHVGQTPLDADAIVPVPPVDVGVVPVSNPELLPNPELPIGVSILLSPPVVVCG